MAIESWCRWTPATSPKLALLAVTTRRTQGAPYHDHICVHNPYLAGKTQLIVTRKNISFLYQLDEPADTQGDCVL